MSGGRDRAREEALRILGRVHGGGNSSRLLELTGFPDPRDRGLATELVLGVLRWTPSLDMAIAKHSNRRIDALDSVVREILRIGAYQLLRLERIPAHAAVATSVELSRRAGRRFASGFVNAVLRSLAGSVPESTLTPVLPAFLAERWSARFGAEAMLRMTAAASRSPKIHLRMIGDATREETIRSLGEDGVQVRPGRYSDRGLVVEEGTPVRSRALLSGRVIVQDESAQLVAMMVGASPGELILDACAAPGGKAIAMADEAGDGVMVVAAERGEGRGKRLSGNVRRTVRDRIAVVITDATAPGLRGEFDRILIDAPCTSTGTLCRNPEVRYRVDAESIARSASRALAIVEGMMPLLKRGGRLVYATCSLEPEENEDLVLKLLATHPQIHRLDAADLLPAVARGLVEDGVFRTHPRELELDGFTAIALEKR